MVRLKEFPLFHILGCLTFLVMGVIINILQLVLFICLAKTNKDLFRRLNYFLMYGIYGYLLFIAEWWSGSSIKIYCDQELKRRIENKTPEENAIILMNHHYELDWLYCWMVADRVGMVGNCRSFIKDSLKYLPILGWAGNFNDDIYIKRNFEKDQSMIQKQLKELTGFPYPVWLHLFPEGTRYTKQKHEASKEFAKSRGLPDLEHHLVPRTRGFTFTLANVDKKKLPTIYDLTMVAGMGSSAPPTMTSLLLGRKTEAVVVIRKIATETIPDGEKEAGEWMMDLFKDKDQIKDSLLNGSWTALNESLKFSDTRLCCVEKVRRTFSLMMVVTVNTLVFLLLTYHLMSGGVLTWVIAGIVLATAWGALHVLVDASKVKKTQ